VIDRGVKLGAGTSTETRHTCVLVVEADVGGEALVLGVMADAVNEVVELGPDDVEPPPAFGGGVKLDHLAGVGKAGKGLVMLLDLDRLLSASEAEAAGTAAGAGAALS
jgi:purine-binding chemotaxis protein CheW